MLLITGKNGQLGQAVADVCTSRGIAFAAFSRTELDIADREAVRRMVLPGTFDAVINCAAYTAVDAAEDNPGKAYAINACGPWNLAATGVPILHVSTDYVFDGKADEPYEVDDAPRPLGVYGLSKRAGLTAFVGYSALEMALTSQAFGVSSTIARAKPHQDVRPLFVKCSTRMGSRCAFFS